MTTPSILKNQKFIEAIKSVENSVKAGFNKRKGLWFPHPSPEGGLATIAYGHKLLPIEATTGMYDKGITEDQALKLLDMDLKIAYDNVKTDWNKYNPGISFEALPEKYQGVLINIGYNTGSLKNRKGVFGWPNLAKKIVNATKAPLLNLTPDQIKILDKAVREGMVTTYLDPKTKTRKRLTSRAYQIADALGIA
jgi:hypothetical protein